MKMLVPKAAALWLNFVTAKRSRTPTRLTASMQGGMAVLGERVSSDRIWFRLAAEAKKRVRWTLEVQDTTVAVVGVNLCAREEMPSRGMSTIQAHTVTVGKSRFVVTIRVDVTTGGLARGQGSVIVPVNQHVCVQVAVDAVDVQRATPSVKLSRVATSPHHAGSKGSAFQWTGPVRPTRVAAGGLPAPCAKRMKKTQSDSSPPSTPHVRPSLVPADSGDSGKP